MLSVDRNLRAKLADRALIVVGAMGVVERPRNSSACMIAA
jgi:hypothetical protein